jgi:F-type H+-transporting ATPase subunit a
MNGNELSIPAVLRLGPLEVTGTVTTTWAIMAVVAVAAWLTTRRLRDEAPGAVQTIVEGIVEAIEASVAAVASDEGALIMPFVGTLWVFLVVANLSGLIPGVHSPTRDLSATAALAFLTFLATHWYGIRSLGLARYLKHYVSPSPILLPFHLISEVTRSVALAVRLFGNIMSLEMAALLILLVAGLLVPVPILMLHAVEALVQAYIFGMLALIYISGGIQSQQARQTQTEQTE